MKKIAWLLAALVLLLCGCGTPPVEERIAPYADEPVLITGLTETDFTVTPAELAQLELETANVSGTSEKSSNVSVTGPTLETFLAQYGYTPADFSKVRFICADQYKIVLKEETLTEYDIILGIAEAKSGLTEERRPLRLLIPGEDSYKWAYGILEIDFVKAEE